MIGDIFKLALVGGLYGQTVVNTFHYRQTTANTSGLPDVESLAKGFNYVNMADVQAALSTSVQYGTIEARTFNPPTVPMQGYDYAITAAGIASGVSCPPSVAVVIRKRTGFLGRKHRGRCFWAGVSVNDVVGGQVTSSAKTDHWDDLVTAMAATITHSVAGSPAFQPVIAALDGGIIVAPVGVRWAAITSCDMDIRLRSQRRREIGVGV